MKIAYSFGIIDLFHYGHLKTLLKAKEASDYHIFGLVSDEAALEWMGTIVSNYIERENVIKNISCIDKVVYQQTLDPLENLKKIHELYPNAEITLYHGNNWRIMPSEQFLDSINGNIEFTEYYDKLKPENILKILNERAVEKRKVSNLISTKANTLVSLKPRLSKSKIESIVVITVKDFNENKDFIINHIMESFDGETIVVRSSSSNEDSLNKSNAGHYESALNIDSRFKDKIINAISLVINSYINDGLYSEDEQILIQSQTKNVIYSGVVFTRDIHHNRPYYLINYDDNGSTDSVTSGIGGKTLWIAHDANNVSYPWDKLIESVKEIEYYLDEMVLDIEFAITENEIVIFQVRPLAANYKFKNQNDDSLLYDLKNNEKNKYLDIKSIFDNKLMMLSDMAFWNPSEIIGSNPRNLDYSLYREIITRQAWNEGLVDIGYKEVTAELMYKIGNKPYISLEYSFMSLIPNNLGKEVTNKLLKFYKDKLKKDLTAHDKIEFEIVMSCYDSDTDDRLLELLDNEFSSKEIDEIKIELKSMTQKQLKNYYHFLNRDIEDLKILSKNRKKIIEDLSMVDKNVFSMIDYFTILINDMKKLATPQFSRQARFAFIARSFCKSFVNKGYFSEDIIENFMMSIETVASSFEKDFNLLLTKKITRENFNEKYGHLRSGTYDIRTDRYDQINFETSEVYENEKDLYKRNSNNVLDLKVLNRALEELGFIIEPDVFVSILRNSIEQREYFKFEFTKSLSLAIELIKEIGKKLNIDRNRLSYLEISDIFASKFYHSENELKEFWETVIIQRRTVFHEKSKLVLPEVILNENDIDIINISESRPNFITQKSISGDLVFLEVEKTSNITDKIVVITKADPGFDWIFAKGIKALITKYGGVASHMAIRCAEFGIPAAIGCGEKIYDQISSFSAIVLDCKNGKIIERR